MLRKRRRQDGFAGLEPDQIAWLHGQRDEWWSLLSVPIDFDFAAFWREHGAPIVAEHIAAKPGTRPLRWWEYEAPELRRRIGGIGEPHSGSLVGMEYERGIPEVKKWIRRDDPGFGAHMLCWAVPIDPNNPPTFESEAAFLKRHNLLSQDEAARLTEADFRRELIAVETPWYCGRETRLLN